MRSLSGGATCKPVLFCSTLPEVLRRPSLLHADANPIRRRADDPFFPLRQRLLLPHLAGELRGCGLRGLPWRIHVLCKRSSYGPLSSPPWLRQSLRRSWVSLASSAYAYRPIVARNLGDNGRRCRAYLAVMTPTLSGRLSTQVRAHALSEPQLREVIWGTGH
jgi:hypothetical protein